MIRAGSKTLGSGGGSGAAGALALRRVAAPVLVQDEATSAVWGMPGAVAHAGLAADPVVHHLGPGELAHLADRRHARGHRGEQQRTDPGEAERRAQADVFA